MMKKFTRTLLTLGLAAVLLAGCGNTTPPSGETEPIAVETTGEETKETVAEPETESDEEIVAETADNAANVNGSAIQDFPLACEGSPITGK